MSISNIKVKVKRMARAKRISFKVTRKDEEDYDWFVTSIIGLGA